MLLVGCWMLAFLPHPGLHGQSGPAAAEELITDRPDFTSARVVPFGHMQLESGFTWIHVNATRGSNGALRNCWRGRASCPCWSCGSIALIGSQSGTDRIGQDSAVLCRGRGEALAAITRPGLESRGGASVNAFRRPRLFFRDSRSGGAGGRVRTCPSAGRMAARLQGTGFPRTVRAISTGAPAEYSVATWVATGGRFELLVDAPHAGGTAVLLHHGYTRLLRGPSSWISTVGSVWNDATPDAFIGFGFCTRF